MAKASLTGFEELESYLDKLAKPEKMAIKAVDAAAPILKKSLQAEIRGTANRTDANGKPYSKGELEASIGIRPAEKNDRGVFSVVRPYGEDSKGMRNAEKLAYLEHGVKVHGQAPHPVRQKAINTAEAGCEKTMRDVIYGEVDKLLR